MSVTALLDEVQKLNDDEKTDLVVGMVSSMSVGNLSTLVKTIEKKFDVVSSGGGGTIVQQPQQTVTPKVDEKTDFSVILKAADAAKKIGLIKEVRAITGLGLKEAKDLVDGAPKHVKDNVPKADAETMKAKLEAAGGTVELI